MLDTTCDKCIIFFNSYSVFITVAVCLFQVASNSSDDIPDENSNNSLLLK